MGIVLHRIFNNKSSTKITRTIAITSATTTINVTPPHRHPRFGALSAEFRGLQLKFLSGQQLKGGSRPGG